MGVCGIVIMLGGIAKIGSGLDSFRLPDCDASGTIDTVKELFKKANAELDEVSNARLVSEADGRNCAAHIKGQGEEANITYRVFWDGWSKRVQIGEVKPDAEPRLNPGAAR